MNTKTPNSNSSSSSSSSSTSMRVLTRPPPSPPPPNPPPQPPPQLQPQLQPQSQPQPPSLSQTPLPPPTPPPSSAGVVVVGFIGRRYSDVSELLNRILDASIFGSCRSLDTPLRIPEDDEFSDGVREWFCRRRVSYYHDRDKGIVFLQSSSLNCPAMASVSEFDDSVVDDHEFGDLQALLFMFTVCHVIVYIQEGSRFDTQILQTFRVLQSAKHALAPFLRSHGILPSLSRSSLSSPHHTQVTPSKNPSPRRGSSISNRNNSTVSIMSGLGLSPALFPGQCTPVTLFAFIDDFSEMMNSSAVVEEPGDTSKSNQSGLSSSVWSNQSMKSSNSVVMLSSPANKSESCLSKKLLSSLEAQIRFLIKKCRVLASSENSSHTGSRSGGISGSAPLLTLDTSRAVVLLDSSGIRRGSSLDFATGLVDDIVSGKITSDSLLLESHSQSGLKEDILTLKEFINRQADILREKGGVVTAAGVGMVAVAAAAAAAASGAAGRPTTIPELPGLEMWLSSSLLILKGILLGKPGSLDEFDAIRKRFRPRNGVPPLVEGASERAVNSPDIAVSILDSGKGINRKFSSLWCQRAMPAAKEVYLKDLPLCYPTSRHQAQLDKALFAFLSMVKGPSVQEFAKRLQDECLSIWESGRQLCDAISLTGNPCMHQRHDTEYDDLSVEAMGKEHNSGFVFLHACACGRSRKLRADPFDFEAANINFNTFPDCDNLLPMLQLPKMNDNQAIYPFPWTVVRLGGSKYYEPSKGLLQAGFSTREKFLLRWTIVVEHDKPPSVSFANALKQGPANSRGDSKIVSAEAEDAKKNNTALVQAGQVQTGVESHEKAINILHSENKISFGRGLPNLTMKKAFSEVVAGPTSSSSAFPPLQSKTQLLYGLGKGVKINPAKVTNIVANMSSGDVRLSGKSEETFSVLAENSKATSNNSPVDGSPRLNIDRNVIPLRVDDASSALEVNVADGGKTRFSPTCRHFVVYVGFEHECPRGHRFILSPEILNQLGQLDCSSEESFNSHPVEHNNRKHKGPVKSSKSDGLNKAPGLSNGNTVDMEKVHNLKLPTEGRTTSDPTILFNHREQIPLDSSNSVADLQQNPHSMNLNDNGPAFSLLNKDIPMYLKCPQCSALKNKDSQNLKFAGTISQLQRIFVVTPSFPIVVVANPVVHFEGTCQPTGVTKHEQSLQFSFGCQVVLPPESFISIRLPFVYGIEVDGKGLTPLRPCEHEPESTAWILRGTALQVICKGSSTV